ncbi:sigma-70 family RNA polymerase sigma factor [Nocardioides lianchengensis]|nr:sigma-70 family RNA polymerase sigma factor [Nocardioides lianchengensis]NYG10027.1 RNA polymerase sigma factor for flagellar operon FliA [Nocardioides lianchengensis]
MTDQDQLVAQHQDLAAAQVRRVLARVPSHVDRHALHATAEAALATAAGTFCPRPGIAFGAHAAATIGPALRDLLRSLPAVPPSPEVSGRLRILEAAILDLPELSRAVVTSSFLRSRPVAAIAHDLGIGEDTVRSLVTALVTLHEVVNATLRSGPSPRRRVPLRTHIRVVRRTTTARFEYPAHRR